MLCLSILQLVLLNNNIQWITMCQVLCRAENTKINIVVLAIMDFCGEKTQKHILGVENVSVILIADTSTTCFGGEEKIHLTQLERERELERYKMKSYQS